MVCIGSAHNRVLRAIGSALDSRRCDSERVTYRMGLKGLPERASALFEPNLLRN